MKKELGAKTKVICALLLCMAICFSSCGEEHSYQAAAESIAWFTSGSFSTYTFTTVEECTDDNGQVIIYIIADYDDKYGKGTTSGILYNGTAGYRYAPEDDYNIALDKPFFDAYYQQKEEGNIKHYSDEEIKTVIELAEEVVKNW